MQFRKLRPYVMPAAALLLFAGGCQDPWYTMEPAVDMAIPPTNPFTLESSPDKLAKKIGQPSDINFFGDQAEYMGDSDGNRYVHVRDMSDFWGFFGECVFTIPAKDWPMEHPMALTYDASQWQDVTWLDKDAPNGTPQNVFLHITPSFPLGAPQTQPATVPPTQDFSQPTTATAPATSTSAPATSTSAPATSTSAPATSTSEPAPGSVTHHTITPQFDKHEEIDDARLKEAVKKAMAATATAPTTLPDLNPATSPAPAVTSPATIPAATTTPTIPTTQPSKADDATKFNK